MSTSGRSVDERREARAGWTVRVFDLADAEAEAERDALFWAEIPQEERAAATWQVSEEAYGLARGKRRQRRLPRSSFVVRSR